MDVEADEDQTVAEAMLAWQRDEPERAAAIVEGFLKRHPEREASLLAKANRAREAAAAPLPRATIECLRCGESAASDGILLLHEGRNLAPFFLGDLGELMVRKLRVEVFSCRACGHVEFKRPTEEER